MNIGILVLLGVTVGVLACFARFFLLLARRAREADKWGQQMTPDPIYPEAS